MYKSKESTTSLSHKIITDCQSIAGELIENLQCNHDLNQKKSVQLHIYHGETLQEHATKIALLMQHKVEIFVKQEILEPFQSFVTSLQEKYPMLFCRELAVTVVE